MEKIQENDRRVSAMTKSVSKCHTLLLLCTLVNVELVIFQLTYFNFDVNLKSEVTFDQLFDLKTAIRTGDNEDQDPGNFGGDIC